MKIYLSFVLCLLAYSSCFSQKIGEENYNLPPGYVLSSKRTILDLSFKIDKTKSVQNYDSTDLKVLKNLSSEQVEEYKDKLGDYYYYYKEGIAYINTLSKKVKDIYTVEEIWYIYIFDQKLKDKLLTIK